MACDRAEVARELQAKKAIGHHHRTASAVRRILRKPGLPDREPSFSASACSRTGRMSTRPRLPRSRRISCARLPHSSNKGSSIAAKNPVYWSIPLRDGRWPKPRSNTRTTSAIDLGQVSASSGGRRGNFLFLRSGPIFLSSGPQPPGTCPRTGHRRCIRTWSMFSPNCTESGAGGILSQTPAAGFLCGKSAMMDPQAVDPADLACRGKSHGPRYDAAVRFWRSFPQGFGGTPKPGTPVHRPRGTRRAGRLRHHRQRARVGVHNRARTRL